MTGTSQELTVGIECDRRDYTRTAAVQCLETLTGARTPELDGAIAVRGKDLTIWTECNCPDYIEILL